MSALLQALAREAKAKEVIALRVARRGKSMRKPHLDCSVAEVIALQKTLTLGAWTRGLRAPDQEVIALRDERLFARTTKLQRCTVAEVIALKFALAQNAMS